MKLADAMQLFNTDPRTLLDMAYVRMAGGGTSSTSGVRTFVIRMAPADQGVWRRNGVPMPTVDIAPWTEVGHEAGDIWKSGDDSLGAVRSHYVAMKKMVGDDTQSPTGTRHTLPGSGGYDVCITGQLTGCTFGIGSQVTGGCCLVSHIQPANPGANASLAAQTTNLLPARFMVQKGEVGGYADAAAVIGHRLYGHWDFFIQDQDRQLKTFEPVREL